MPIINFSEVNWIAVLVAAFATFMLGGLWYTALFGTAWQTTHGYSDEQLKDMRTRRPPPVFFGTMIACYLVMAIVLALLIQATDVNTAGGGAMIGLLVFVVAVAVGATGHVASHWPWSAFMIDALYQLIYLAGSGAILGAWQ